MPAHRTACKGLVARSLVEQEGNRVAENLPQQPTRQMPEVFRPHPLYGIALRELAEERVDPVPKAAQAGISFWMRIVSLLTVRCQRLYALLGQFRGHTDR